MTVACVGECMVELVEQPDGLLRRGFGGDTLNTAVYLARLGTPVDYVTALGTDEWSDAMLAGWQAEGVGTGRVLRSPDHMPGLYVIQTDARGERRFRYWRDTSAARHLFNLPDSPGLAAALADYDLIYLSGITLSLYGEAGRARLFDALERARHRGGRIAFDTNFRPHCWPRRAEAAEAYARALRLSDIVLASQEDIEHLDGMRARLAGCAEVVLKQPTLACRLRTPEGEWTVATPCPRDPIDTTAAGDSFAAAYLAARLAGLSPEASARCGHRLAGEVVRHRGALIPRAAMPTDLSRILAGAPA